jgi:hypothetical protein
MRQRALEQLDVRMMLPIMTAGVGLLLLAIFG